jgi:hypothetical protein
LVNRRKYQEPFRGSFTTEKSNRDLLHNLGFTDTYIYNYGIGILLDSTGKNDKTPLPIQEQIIHIRKEKIAEEQKNLDTAENFLMERKIQAEQKRLREISAVEAYKSVFDDIERCIQHLPEYDLEIDQTGFWVERASRIISDFGFQVSSDDCMKYVRNEQNKRIEQEIKRDKE